ncbi:hypothetical protein MMC28_006527 [Mycoblastus sanguinarius]|nr:hypothetical protein [Mycoblastus sanguinarius]
MTGAKFDLDGLDPSTGPCAFSPTQYIETQGYLVAKVKVYPFAEMRNITEFRDCVKAEFESLASEYCPFPDLTTMLYAAFSTTPSNDIGLRSMMISICSKRYKGVIKDGRFLSIVSEYEELGAGALRTRTHSLGDEIERVTNLYESIRGLRERK